MVKADTPAWYVRRVEGATPSACRLVKRAVNEMSAVQGWESGLDLRVVPGPGIWPSVTERERVSH